MSKLPRPEGARRSEGDSDDALSEKEQQQVQETAALRAVVIHEIVREEGENELARPVSALAISGLAAGLSMGFSFLADGLLKSGLPDAPWGRLIASFGYSVGFLIVVLGRQQLFTESTLTALLPLLYRRDRKTLALTLRLWAVVLTANLFGTFLFACALAWTGVLGAAETEAMTSLARQAIADPFSTTLAKAIFAGWLIALMVWLLPAAGSAKILVIIVLTYVVALGGLAHIIAGSSEVAFLVARGDATVADYLLRFMIPTLCGNTIGGVALVAILNHGTVSPELAPEGSAGD